MKRRGSGAVFVGLLIMSGVGCTSDDGSSSTPLGLTSTRITADAPGSNEPRPIFLPTLTETGATPAEPRPASD